MTRSKQASSTVAASAPRAVASRDAFTAMMLQGWISIVVWMSFGLLLEGLLGYKIPSYLGDAQRRELFRLAHTHGTLLGVLLVAAALCGRQGAAPPRVARGALRIGAVLMPLGFLLADIRRPEGDPGLAIWIVAPAALMVIFGAICFAIAFGRKTA